MVVSEHGASATVFIRKKQRENTDRWTLIWQSLPLKRVVAKSTNKISYKVGLLMPSTICYYIPSILTISWLLPSSDTLLYTWFFQQADDFEECNTDSNISLQLNSFQTSYLTKPLAEEALQPNQTFGNDVLLVRPSTGLRNTGFISRLILIWKLL